MHHYSKFADTAKYVLAALICASVGCSTSMLGTSDLETFSVGDVVEMPSLSTAETSESLVSANNEASSPSTPGDLKSKHAESTIQSPQGKRKRKVTIEGQQVDPAFLERLKLLKRQQSQVSKPPVDVSRISKRLSQPIDSRQRTRQVSNSRQSTGRPVIDRRINAASAKQFTNKRIDPPAPSIVAASIPIRRLRDRRKQPPSSLQYLAASNQGNFKSPILASVNHRHENNSSRRLSSVSTSGANVADQLEPQNAVKAKNSATMNHQSDGSNLVPAVIPTSNVEFQMRMKGVMVAASGERKAILKTSPNTSQIVKAGSVVFVPVNNEMTEHTVVKIDQAIHLRNNQTQKITIIK